MNTRMKSLRQLALVVLALPLLAVSPADRREQYLGLAAQLAATVEQTALHQPTGLYGSVVDTRIGAPAPVRDMHYSGWYLPGLWMLYWQTGEKKYLDVIDRESAAFWSRCVNQKIGLPYMKYNLADDRPENHNLGHRIEYQVLAHRQWPAYVRSLRAAEKYQIKADAAGLRTIVNTVDERWPAATPGASSPGYFACMDLRIPYALGVIDRRPELYQVAVDDFTAHLVEPTPATGLWNGALLAPDPLTRKLLKPFYPKPPKTTLWTPGRHYPTLPWSGGLADGTYSGLILADVTGRPEFLPIVIEQTRLAVKHCYQPDQHYFYRAVDERTGRVLDNRPQFHTNWEWALTLFILGEITGDESFTRTGEDNYRFLMGSLDDPEYYGEREHLDWNVPQQGLLCLFRYHQTGERRYLDDAYTVADHLVAKRIKRVGEQVYMGQRDLVNLRDVGDMIALLVCLSDPALPMVSSRYFLFPVGIRTPSLPVLGDAYADRYYTAPDGTLTARVLGGQGSEDIYVMDLSGTVQKVKVNGREVEWKEKKVAGQRYVVLPAVSLGDVTIEIVSPNAN